MTSPGARTSRLPVPDTEELSRSPVPLRERRGILFLGNFLHEPNRDAAEFLCEEIVPRLDPSLLAKHEISIVGTAAEEQVGELAEGLPHVRIVGWVPSVIPYLQAARTTAVPLRYGAGTKRKVVQALMVGTPTVTTTVGAEGLGVEDRREVLIADDAEPFAAAIERLAARLRAWRRLARRGRKQVLGFTDARPWRHASTRCWRPCWHARHAAAVASATEHRRRSGENA